MPASRHCSIDDVDTKNMHAKPPVSPVLLLARSTARTNSRRAPIRSKCSAAWLGQTLAMFPPHSPRKAERMHTRQPIALATRQLAQVAANIERIEILHVERRRRFYPPRRRRNRGCGSTTPAIPRPHTEGPPRLQVHDQEFPVLMLRGSTFRNFERTWPRFRTFDA